MGVKGTWLGDYGKDIFFDSCPGSAGAVLFTKPPFSEGFISIILSLPSRVPPYKRRDGTKGNG